MFDKIIVPLDGSRLSEQIIPYASALAKGMHIPVQLLHVVNPDTEHLRDPGEVAHPVFYDQLLEQQQGWARLYVQAMAKRLEDQGVNAEARVAVGTPEHEIVEAAGYDGQGLVAMATHGRAGIGRMVLGSVADRVLQQGRMPLLLFNPKDRHAAFARAPRTIIVALDGSTLAERALTLGQYLARAVGARLLLVRVVPIYSYAIADPEVIAYGAYPDTVSLARAETRSYLGERERDVATAGLNLETLMLEGDPAHELVKLASSTPDSTTVMTTHGRSGIARTILGSVADEVVRRSGTPVLLLRAAEV